MIMISPEFKSRIQTAGALLESDGDPEFLQNP